jgi:hypothetical protein
MRKHIQVLVPVDRLDTPGVEAVDTSTWLPALRPDIADKMREVVVVNNRFKPEIGCYIMLIAHDDYPELAEYQEAPLKKLDDENVAPNR